MTYGDEILILKRTELKKKLYHSIFADSVTIDEVRYTFSEQCINDDFSIYLPDQFIQLNYEDFKLKYISDVKPQFVISDQSGKIDWAFHVHEYNNSNIDITSRLKAYRKEVKLTEPGNCFFDEGVHHLESTIVGFYDYRSPGLDEDIYSLFFFFDLYTVGEVFGWFTAQYTKYKLWKPLVEETIKTIKVLQHYRPGGAVI